MSQKYQWYNFPNVGYVVSEYTNDQLKPIRDEIEKISSSFDKHEHFNTNLVGHIQKEYLLKETHDYIYNLVAPLIVEYEKHFNYLETVNIFNKNLPLFLDKTWVNFQKKHEFNPPHDHSGLFSFAIWMKMPYNIEDEKQHFPHMKESDNRTASFTFHYTNSLGKISECVFPVDKTWENKIVVFPSKMVHSVNPFYTSDEYRISVSGNFRFDATI